MYLTKIEAIGIGFIGFVLMSLGLSMEIMAYAYVSHPALTGQAIWDAVTGVLIGLFGAFTTLVASMGYASYKAH